MTHWSCLQNDQAFATPNSVDARGETTLHQVGLTKREYFAAVALQGFISLSLDAETAKRAPAAAVNMADRLIDELNKVKS